MRLAMYDERFKEVVDTYELTEEYLYYTGHPIDCIKLTQQDSSRFSILAMNEEQLVTFFDLHKDEGVKPYSTNEKAILLRAFSTDSRYQGKGYAKQALQLLPAFVQANFHEINEIVLAVNIRNEAAQGLYKKCGFVDEGVREMGPKGELIIMSYYL